MPRVPGVSPSCRVGCEGARGLSVDHIDPDLQWYTGISQRKGLRSRCPFASVHRCPRFYQSLSLLGEAGSTRIEPKEEQRLLRKWKQSDLWPTTREQETWIAGEPGNPAIYSNFCPEVAYDRFGLFALNLARYADDIDLEAAYARLGRIDARGNDWRWAWSSVAPMHYTECPLYSPLDLDSSRDGLHGGDENAPRNVLQAVIRTIWNWNPFWRYVALAVLIILLAAFTIWRSLPEQTKQRLLDALPGGVAERTAAADP